MGIGGLEFGYGIIRFLGIVFNDLLCEINIFFERKVSGYTIA